MRDEDEEKYEAYKRFCDRVEWGLVVEITVKYNTLTRGHLPYNFRPGTQVRHMTRGTLFSRVETCKI
ncbi:hypothetical protein [Nostoc sp. 106C]|uniref:hypothetical protein n=1 Tax=Nostoc sp. 106C TaxID=1932667 RepID=UPI001065F3BF|nr:hypothetical protein [Nostoc sp. 106C]